MFFHVCYVCGDETATFTMCFDGSSGGNPLNAADLVMRNFNSNKNWVFGKLESVKCSGCDEEQPNQMAHMDYGGCLWDQGDSVVDETGLVYASRIEMS